MFALKRAVLSIHCEIPQAVLAVLVVATLSTVIAISLNHSALSSPL
jgi:hypothetical protein